MGHRGSGSTRYSEELAVREAGNIVLEKGMATSIGQYAPAFLPGELHFLTEAWQATVYRVAKSSTQREAALGAQTQDFFFACGSSAPVRVEYEDGAAAWLVGTLAAPSVQGHGLPPLQELWPYQSLFLSLL